MEPYTRPIQLLTLAKRTTMENLMNIAPPPVLGKIFVLLLSSIVARKGCTGSFKIDKNLNVMAPSKLCNSCIAKEVKNEFEDHTRKLTDIFKEDYIRYSLEFELYQPEEYYTPLKAFPRR